MFTKKKNPQNVLSFVTQKSTLFCKTLITKKQNIKKFNKSFNN